MQIGEIRETLIVARRHWNDTGVDMVAGGIYHIVNTGSWWDLFIRTDADGYDSVLSQRLFETKRRVPQAKWFAAIGTIGKNDTTAFVIGRELRWSASESGRLFSYANDLYNFYFNNFGRITMRIERIR